MLNLEIEKLRDRLNAMIESDDVSNEEILKVSQELDILILQYQEGNIPLKVQCKS